MRTRPFSILFTRRSSWSWFKDLMLEEGEAKIQRLLNAFKPIKFLLSGTKKKDSITSMQLSVPRRTRLKIFFFPWMHISLLLQLVGAESLPGGRSCWNEELRKFILFSKRAKHKHERLFGYLAHLCLVTGKLEHLEALLYLLRRNRTEVERSTLYPILLAMDKHGWYDEMKTNFRLLVERGVKCKVEVMFTLIVSAAQRGDFKFAIELFPHLNRMASTVDVTDKLFFNRLPIEELVDACIGKRQEGLELMEEALAWYNNLNGKLDEKTVSALVKFAQRFMSSSVC